MIGRPASHTIEGPAGLLETVVDDPKTAAPLGLAVIAHPNPQQGGTLDNKVVYTLSRAFVLAGWRAVRFNFRGIGRSGGMWDAGVGEVDDMLAVIAHHQGDPVVRGRPLVLAGFSFGGFVAARAHARVSPLPQGLILVGPATSRPDMPAVPEHTLVVHGEQDDVVPLSSVLDWARPQSLPITVVPGVGHFFHGQLPVLRELVLRHLRATVPAVHSD
ncbi:MAG: alpha/beta hydrolase [Burkholderiales bacterium]|nr:alpha/beta hydrolase [Burkholderiales bacterium]